ncbi:hypothetical protein ALC57_16893, partial [Trachymyrmex cornetzi]
YVERACLSLTPALCKHRFRITSPLFASVHLEINMHSLSFLSIPSGRRNASLITIIKEFLRSPKATAYPSLVKSKER